MHRIAPNNHPFLPERPMVAARRTVQYATLRIVVDEESSFDWLIQLFFFMAVANQSTFFLKKKFPLVAMAANPPLLWQIHRHRTADGTRMRITAVRSL